MLNITIISFLKLFSFPMYSGTNETQVIELPIVDMLSPRPPYLPLAIPRDLSDRMIRLHGDPQVWWIGQFMKYSFMTNSAFVALVNN